ncbi:restriction endonuclease subunit S [Candidatus Shapirobacteria bacterium]|nr:restriction endonuclease subunit S [Candidatus Shapirobacteria bacterium]
MKTKTQKFKQTEIGEIPEDWNILRIGNLGRVITGKTPPTKDMGNYNGNIPFVCIPDLGKSVYIAETNKTLSEKGALAVKNCLLPENAIVVSCIATIGLTGITKKPSVTNQQINSIIPNDRVTPRFLYYRLQNFKQILSSYGSGGSVFNIVSKSKFENIILAIPPVSEQQRIASILSSLDDKIELNRQMNKTLEEIGKALFKRWFVDFEFPNDEGKPYKSSGGEMVESELGMIPKGWEVATLPQVAKIQKGLSYKGKDLVDSAGIALVGLKCFERGGGFRKDGIKFYKGDYKEEHKLKTGNLIVAMTDLTQAAEVLGKPALVPTIPEVTTLVASLDLSIIKPTTEGIDEYYLYLLLSRRESQDFLFGYSNGSTVLHLSAKGLQEFKLIKPQEGVLRDFQELNRALFNRLMILDIENTDLAAIRDSILPRLMSGKLRVN